MQRTYEIPLLIKPVLPADVEQKVIEPTKKLVKKLGGELSIQVDKDGKELEVSKRHLAYPIDGIEEGYYAFLKLVLDAAKLPELEKSRKFNQDVLRYLVIREDQL
ncbi:30S ribosomal protein S6 [Candidatus Dojkabacteria bacterium]|uniref:Small ribosomal subunit protein bS6 n=1 Tax=Candidatus Dojkabacteria bacterium TaxID=2099670 RepID=A0A955I5Q3_9BACT|nr:30S ribosomal protein S6 [Candidatus Dojkabacteria bacterium]